MGTLIRLTAVIACAIIGISFLMFAVDELDKGSKTQQDALGQVLGDGSSAAAATEDPERSGVAGAIDRAADTLLGPFDDLVDSDDAWVEHGVPTVLGLLLYGLGLGVLANYLPGERRSGGDWRTA